MNRTLPTPMTADTGNWSIKVLCDHACPMCRREVVCLNNHDKHGRVFFEDISAPGFDASRDGIEQNAHPRIIRLQQVEVGSRWTMY